MQAQSPERTAPAASTPSPVAAWSEPAACLCYVPLASLLMQLLSLATPWHSIAQADGNVVFSLTPSTGDHAYFGWPNPAQILSLSWIDQHCFRHRRQQQMQHGSVSSVV